IEEDRHKKIAGLTSGRGRGLWEGVERRGDMDFAGKSGMLLIAVDGGGFSDKLVFEPSRGGDLFPHIYADLPLATVLWEAPLPLDEAG
ncbi:DUF952 domain-containing protein, partial [Rhizobium ruizarguesonis]